MLRVLCTAPRQITANPDTKTDRAICPFFMCDAQFDAQRLLRHEAKRMSDGCPCNPPASLHSAPSLTQGGQARAEYNSRSHKKSVCFQRIHLIRLTAPSPQGEGKNGGFPPRGKLSMVRAESARSGAVTERRHLPVPLSCCLTGRRGRRPLQKTSLLCDTVCPSRASNIVNGREK